MSRSRSQLLNWMKLPLWQLRSSPVDVTSVEASTSRLKEQKGESTVLLKNLNEAHSTQSSHLPSTSDQAISRDLLSVNQNPSLAQSKNIDLYPTQNNSGIKSDEREISSHPLHVSSSSSLILSDAFDSSKTWQLTFACLQNSIILFAADGTETSEEMALWQKIIEGLNLKVWPPLAWPCLIAVDTLNMGEFDAFLNGVLVRITESISDISKLKLFHMGSINFNWKQNSSIELPLLKNMLENKVEKKRFIDLIKT